MSALTLYRDGKSFDFRLLPALESLKRLASYVYSRKAKDGIKTIIATMTDGKDHLRYRVTCGTELLALGHVEYADGEIGDYLDARCQVEEAILDIISNEEL